jgi:hypothetical protein
MPYIYIIGPELDGKVHEGNCLKEGQEYQHEFELSGAGWNLKKEATSAPVTTSSFTTSTKPKSLKADEKSGQE